jgi:glycosyltransferase involved in cell wall biosynthesis
VDFPIHTLPLGLNALKYRFGVACYLAVAARVRDVLIEGGVPPNRIRVVPSSVDISRFEGASAEGLREEFGIAPSAKVVVNVGSLVGHKAQWHLVRAMPHVLERFPEAVCILVGEGPTRRRLETLAQELGIGKHVIFAGFRQDVARFISLCDVFAVSSEMEGLCSTILEAMALRRPVVSTRAGGIPDIVKDGVNGLLVAPGDPDALARGMLRVLENPRAASELAEEGRRTVERRFTTERMVASTLAVYEELLGRRRGLE